MTKRVHVAMLGGLSAFMRLSNALAIAINPLNGIAATTSATTLSSPGALSFAQACTNSAMSVTGTRIRLC